MKKIFAGILFFSLMLCGTAFAAEQSVTDYLNSITNGPSAYTQLEESPTETDAYWAVTGSGQSAATMIVEFAGNANTNSFGIFDRQDDTNTVQIFSGPQGAGSKATISVYNNGIVTVNDILAGHFASGNDFGFYMGTASYGNFFSDSTLNADMGYDHMWTYVGTDTSDITLPGQYGSTTGTWTDEEYVLAWEDVPYSSCDGDHNDMMVMVESVHPVPEPGTLMLLGSGLVGIAFYKRRK